ncbi:MAG: hypothetical protein ACE5HF_07120 [Gemmatimonadota bacterium]
MPRSALTAALSVLIAACAGSSAAPVFEYRPAEGPLRYSIKSDRVTSVSTPQGDQTVRGSVRAVVALELGPMEAEGRAVRAVFEDLSVTTETAFGSTPLSAKDLIGKPFEAVLSAGGQLSIREAPELPQGVAGVMDPAALLADLLLPMPPADSDPRAGWPVSRLVTSDVGLHVVNMTEGTAAVAGDTAWNGQSARIVGFDGTLNTEVSGTPPGSPGPLEMKLEGTTSTRGVWDDVHGLMLGARTTRKTEGTIETMGFTMPATYEGDLTVELVTEAESP